jgi:hypothetical protein
LLFGTSASAKPVSAFGVQTQPATSLFGSSAKPATQPTFTATATPPPSKAPSGTFNFASVTLPPSPLQFQLSTTTASAAAAPPSPSPTVVNTEGLKLFSTPQKISTPSSEPLSPSSFGPQPGQSTYSLTDSVPRSRSPPLAQPVSQPASLFTQPSFSQPTFSSQPTTELQPALNALIGTLFFFLLFGIPTYHFFFFFFFFPEGTTPPQSPVTGLLVLVSMLFKSNRISAKEKSTLKDLIIAENYNVLCAYEVFQVDNDLDELADTLRRIVNLS